MSDTVRGRFRAVMTGTLPADRLPMLEWASWWDKTIERWRGEGLDPSLGWPEIKTHLGLDVDRQAWIGCWAARVAQKHPGHGGGYIDDTADYDAIVPSLYPETVAFDRAAWAEIAEQQARGEVIVWITLEGFFWWPRVLFGIEPHLYAFYDHPELMHRINADLLAYQRRALAQFCEVCTPDFMTFAEDMSYNHGPMISKELFDEFMAPYYRAIIPEITARGIWPLIDSDGDVEPLIPWFEAVGLEGILPLERMAGVDVARIRANHPTWKMMGGYDKTVMHLGEAAIRAEFERLLPVMRQPYFCPSVDHQTPPGVSLADYHLYMRLFREYAAKACAG
jgi:hypothetical protein